VPLEIRRLIREMSIANPLWGAPRIHGDLICDRHRIARQITEAFPWDGAPGYMIRDRDRIYGAVVTRRLRAMGIRDKPIAPASEGPGRMALLNG
jgi:hypothetical protein